MSLFATGFLVAAFGVIACAILAVSEQGAIGGLGTLFYALLTMSALIIAALAGAVSVRAARIFMGRRFGTPAPRLHIRFMALFCARGRCAVDSDGASASAGSGPGGGILVWRAGDNACRDHGRGGPGTGTAGTEPCRVATRQHGRRPVLSRSGRCDDRQPYRIHPISAQFKAIGRNFAAAYVLDSQSTVLARAEAAGRTAFRGPVTGDV